MRLVQQNSTKAFNIYMGTSGLTLAITLSKNGGAFNSVSPTVLDRSNGYYSITPIASHRDTVGENAWLFAAAGQTSIPRVEYVTAADPDAVAFGSNTVAPDNASASAAAASAASADGKLTAGRLSRLDRLPDVVAGASGGLALVGSTMALTNENLTALFADADIAGLLGQISALIDGADDLAVQVIAAASGTAAVNSLIANGQWISLIADAAAAKVAAQAANAALPAIATSSTNAATSSATAATKSTEARDRIYALTEASGQSFRFTAIALALAPTGSGGTPIDPEDLASEIVTQLATLESRPLAVLQTPPTAPALHAYTATTWAVRLQNLPAITGWKRIYFTLKADDCCADTDALVQLRVSSAAPDQLGDGLQRIAKRAPKSGETGSIEVVDDAPAAELILHLSAAAAASVPPGEWKYDLKVLFASNVELRVDPDLFEVRPSVTQAII